MYIVYFYTIYFTAQCFIASLKCIKNNKLKLITPLRTDGVYIYGVFTVSIALKRVYKKKIYTIAINRK